MWLASTTLTRRTSIRFCMPPPNKPSAPHVPAYTLFRLRRSWTGCMYDHTMLFNSTTPRLSDRSIRCVMLKPQPKPHAICVRSAPRLCAALSAARRCNARSSASGPTAAWSASLRSLNAHWNAVACCAISQLHCGDLGQQSGQVAHQCGRVCRKLFGREQHAHSAGVARLEKRRPKPRALVEDNRDAAHEECVPEAASRESVARRRQTERGHQIHCFNEVLRILEIIAQLGIAELPCRVAQARPDLQALRRRLSLGQAVRKALR